MLAADQHGVGKLERIGGQGIDLGPEGGDLLGGHRHDDHAGIGVQEFELAAGGLGVAPMEHHADLLPIIVVFPGGEDGVVDVEQREDGLAVADEDRGRVLGAVDFAEQASARRREGGLDPIGQEIVEQDIGIDRPVVPDLLGQRAGVFGQFADPGGELLGRLLDFEPVRPLHFDLALQLLGLFLQMLLVRLADDHGHGETLDLFAGVGLVGLQLGDRLLLAVGERALLVQLALQLGQLLLGQARLLAGGLRRLAEFLGGPLGVGQGGGQPGFLRLQFAQSLLPLAEGGIGLGELLLELLAVRLLVGQRLAHRVDQVLVLGGGGGVGRQLRDRRLRRGARAPPSPSA